MILLIVSILLITGNSLVISINNIHYGYRNIYSGEAELR